MKIECLENELRNLKLTHLTESELVAYCDQELDQMCRTRVDAHLQGCFICTRRLVLLQEERAALSNRRIGATDGALVERLIERIGVAQPPQAETAKGISWRERLAEYLEQMVASWQFQFAQAATRSAHDQGEEVWQWQGLDGKLQARAILEKNAALTIHFSSTEIDLDGVRLNVRLGPLNHEITLRQVSDGEVHGKVEISRRSRPRKLADISIELL